MKNYGGMKSYLTNKAYPSYVDMSKKKKKKKKTNKQTNKAYVTVSRLMSSLNDTKMLFN
jgi:hypothetical protein